ncbi:Antitoxin HigA-2 [Phycisphaerales bacterium]|nr:Antitoxin HigA-2 [Phycisphaerales bacterium]
MKRAQDYDTSSVFEQIKQSIAHARGVRTLRTTTLPAHAPSISKSRVVSIRKKAGMSQAVFARFLNVPTKTLQSCEHGARRPKAGEARLLQVFEAAPDELASLIGRAEPRARSRRTSRGRAAGRGA